MLRCIRSICSGSVGELALACAVDVFVGGGCGPVVVVVVVVLVVVVLVGDGRLLPPPTVRPSLTPAKGSGFWAGSGWCCVSLGCHVAVLEGCLGGGGRQAVGCDLSGWGGRRVAKGSGGLGHRRLGGWVSEADVPWWLGRVLLVLLSGWGGLVCRLRFVGVGCRLVRLGSPWLPSRGGFGLCLCLLSGFPRCRGRESVNCHAPPLWLELEPEGVSLQDEEGVGFEFVQGGGLGHHK